MKKILLKLFLATSVLTIACNKKNNNSVDVSQQWKTDDAGALLSGLSDGQWANKNFTAQELSLFNSLDTIDLTGTTTPDSVFEEKPLSHNYIFPNPFHLAAKLYLNFPSQFSGQLVVKYVIVNSNFNVVYKAAVRLQATVCPACTNSFSSNGFIDLTPIIPSGQFRIYYTLSSQASPDFYKTWGNIQKN
jgi:hypothetical protein